MGTAGAPRCAARVYVLLSSAKETELLICVNKTYINLTQPSIGRRFGFGPGPGIRLDRLKVETNRILLVCIWQGDQAIR